MQETGKTDIELTINGEVGVYSVDKDQSLLSVLRDNGFMSVKCGCDDGTCGVCTVLIDNKPFYSCKISAVDVNGSAITTLEGISTREKLHPVQESFMESGAIQCGYCTPSLIMVSKSLLEKNPNPTDDEIREELDSVLCRCTGYVRVVDAVHRASARLQGKTLMPPTHLELPLPEDLDQVELPQEFHRKEGDRKPLPPLVYTPLDMPKTEVVGAAEVKVDARKLAQGLPVFTDDFKRPKMLYAAMLTSPHAHANIREIDATAARALPGVKAVLTHKDLPRTKYATGGQSYPQPLPYDQVCLDSKVRHVGDRVAVVAAESLAIAEEALKLIKVDYEVLPAVVDPEQAMQPGAPIIHDEGDTKGIYDANRNIVHHISAEVGEVDQAFAEADHVFEREYRTPKQQHVHLEPHVCITYFDEDERLVVRTSTQVPFHVRRMLAPLIGLPEKRIRVIKPRIGGGFGNKQEMLLEDLCALLTLKTGCPVRMEYTRTQEFITSRCRHNTVIRYKVGVKDNKVTVAQLYLIGDTGAYGCHGLTVNMVGGFKGLTLYNPPNSRFVCDVVYTNTIPSGAFRGYGAMQCEYGIEVMMEEIAEQLGLDVVEFKKDNWIKIGEPMHLSEQLGEGRPGVAQSLNTSGFLPCLTLVRKATDFDAKRQEFRSQKGRFRQGIGVAVVMHGSGIANLDMASATLKMNDDGSFNLLIGATDLGTGSDTILGQIAAEVLGIPLNDIIVYSSDTDFTPFDKGAYASSTTYISGEAVRKCAYEIKKQVFDQVAVMLGLDHTQGLILKDKKVVAPDGRSATMREIALSSLHMDNQHQIMATSSHYSPVSPPPTAAQVAEVLVDTLTGEVKVERLVMAIDCGRVINPLTAAGQVEGGMAQALGFALTEEMLYDKEGQPLNPNLRTYHVPRASRMPAMDVIFVQTDEPTGPFGAKSVSEISIDGVAPAVASAIHNATGVWLRELPYTPDRVLAGLHKKKAK